MNQRMPLEDADLASQPPVPVLFIAGMGRSGSTLLDRMLGERPGFVSAGELRLIWERSFRDDDLCGCGSPFSKCPLWTQVVLEAFGDEPVDWREVLELKKRVDRLRAIPFLAFGHRPKSLQRSLDRFGLSLERLYRALLETTGARVVVDSSKTPSYGFALAALPAFRVHILHLIRDSRAVAFSWKRLRRRPEVQDRDVFMPRYNVVESALRWDLHNVASSVLGWSGSGYTRVTYEDFVEDPESILTQISATLLGDDQRGDRQVSDHLVDLTVAHTVSGNPGRFQQGKISIAPDHEWIGELPDRDRTVITALTAPLLLRYGYPLRTPKRRS